MKSTLIRFSSVMVTALLASCASSPAVKEVAPETVSLPQYAEPFNGSDLTGWREPRGKWAVAGLVEPDSQNSGDADPSAMFAALVNGAEGRTSNLLSDMEHGDIELILEFNVPKGSNSGVYLQGRYEIQILDSWQKYQPTFADCGGIYQRHLNGQGFEGTSPRVNASLPPGEWQRFDIHFRAPRFDEEGKKVENARFVKVIHNGVVIHENVEVTGPTRSASFEDEKPWGPLMLQGDHGPIGFRNLLGRHTVFP
jgi:hypothetical protein